MRRLALMISFLFSAAALAGPFTPSPTPTNSGIRASIDLPTSQHMQNVGGSDGLGLCVFTSVQHAARWQNIVDLDGYRRWMEARPGGGYPQKVDNTLAAFCKSKGVPVPDYVQHTGGDDTFLDLAILTGRCPCITYSGSDDFYRGGVDHMVNLAHLDEKKAAIIDNNRPGTWLWMSRTDLLSRWRARGGGWAIVFLDPPPTVYGSEPVASAALCICGEECTCKKGDCPGKCPLMIGQCRGGKCSTSEPVYDPFDVRDSDGNKVKVLTWEELSERDRGVLWVGNKPPASLIVTHTGYRPSSSDWPPGVYDYWKDASGQRLVQRREHINVPVAAAPPIRAEVEPPTGVIPGRVHDAPHYAISGQPCTKDDAADALKDDRAKWHLAVVGDPEFITRVRADVGGLGEVRGKLHVQYYKPGAWQVSQLKLADGVTLRKPSTGRVSADVGWVSPAEYGQAKLMELLGRPLGPIPRPAPQPKPDDPQPAPNNPLPNIPPLWLGLGALILYLLFKRKA